MFIITQLLLPIFFGLILYLFFKQKFNWKETLALEGASLLIIIIGYFSGMYSRSADTEYWSDAIIAVEYYEPYETWVDKTCHRDVACGKDEDGNTKYCDEEYDCSYCDENSASYYEVGLSGNKYSISRQRYLNLVSKFDQKPVFVEINRDIDYHGFCGKDGDKYRCEWQGEWHKAETYSTEHIYKNKIQYSNSIFNFRKLDTIELKEVYRYPLINGMGVQNHIIGTWYNKNDQQTANQYLTYYNGINGAKKQLKTFIFIYHDKPEYTGELQQKHFKNGNKNEYIILLNYDSKVKEITWSKIITWCEVANVKNEMESYLASHTKSSLFEITQNACRITDKSWKRKQFADFDYLRIQPSTTAWTVTFIISLIVITVLSIVFYKNDFFN